MPRPGAVLLFLLGAAFFPIAKVLEFPSLPPSMAVALWPWAPALFVGLASIVVSLCVPSVSMAFPLGASSFFAFVALVVFSQSGYQLGYWIVELLMAVVVLLAGLAGETLARAARLVLGRAGHKRG